MTSPTYRALETVRLAQLPNPQPYVELGDGGQSMQGVSDAQGVWLRERALRLPKGTNTIIVTHMPNIAHAFPDWGAVADGKTVIVAQPKKAGRGRSVESRSRNGPNCAGIIPSVSLYGTVHDRRP